MASRMISSQAQQHFGQILERTLAGEDVVIERYGVPRVAIIAYQRYEELLEAERELLTLRLQRASEAASRRAAHLADDEIDELVERARTETQGEPAS